MRILSGCCDPAKFNSIEREKRMSELDGPDIKMFGMRVMLDNSLEDQVIYMSQLTLATIEAGMREIKVVQKGEE